MSSPKAEGIEFEVSVIGETTGRQYVGKFRAKEKLSFRDRMLMDKIRRELVGPNPVGVSTESLNLSGMLAELSVRLTESPIFWKESGGGQDLFDDNVLMEVFGLAIKVERDAVEATQKEGEAAKAALTDLRREQEQLNK